MNNHDQLEEQYRQKIRAAYKYQDNVNNPESA